MANPSASRTNFSQALAPLAAALLALGGCARDPLTMNVLATSEMYSIEYRLSHTGRLTVVHNGILVHLHQAIQGPTGHKRVASYDVPHGPVGPIMLRDHGDLVRFRNIWVRPIEDYDQE